MLFQTPPPQDLYKPVIAIVSPAVEKPDPPTVEYKVVENDSLEKIASDQHTTVQKLFNKNTGISDPNIIEVGQTLVIPAEAETLTERVMPVSIEVQKFKLPQTSPPSGGFSSSVAGYEFGWCTYYAAQQRPDLHIVDNASGWIRYSNGTTPRIGAVAVNTWAAGGLGHVGIVVGIDGNRIQVRSMNYQRFGVVTTDWTDASYWAGYIY